MGYDIYDIHMSARLERHNGPGDRADNAAFERFNAEIRAMVDADPDYRRIFEYNQRVPYIRVPA